MHWTARVTAGVGVVVLSLAAPVLVHSMVSRRDAWGMPVLAVMMLCVWGLCLPLRAEAVYATASAVEVRRRGGWVKFPWASLGAIEPVPLMSRGGMTLFRVPVAREAKPISFYGDAAAQARFEHLQRRAHENGGEAWDEVTTSTQVQSESPPAYPAAVSGAGPFAPGNALRGEPIHAPRRTTWAPLLLAAITVVEIVNLAVSAHLGTKAGLIVHGLVGLLALLATMLAFETVRLFATPANLQVLAREGAARDVPWASVRGPEPLPWPLRIPATVIRLYALRDTSKDRRLFFFGNLDGLRTLHQHVDGNDS